MNPAETCQIDGSVKDHCTELDCCIYHSVHSNSLKPILTEENMLARLLMANHFRDPQDPSKYHDMCDHIHLDEKWFFLT